jgi:hypothetical protein
MSEAVSGFESLQPIRLNLEDDKDAIDNPTYFVVSWGQPGKVVMQHIKTKEPAKVNMLPIKFRKYFDNVNDAQAYAETLRKTPKEQYFYHMVVDMGRWRCVLVDEEAMEAVGTNFAYTDDQPVLKEIMEGAQASFEEGRADLRAMMTDAFEETKMWRELQTMSHTPVEADHNLLRVKQQQRRAHFEEKTKGFRENKEDIFAQLAAIAKK